MAAAGFAGLRVRFDEALPFEAVQDAQCIYTDVWASMGEESEAEARHKLLAPFQVNEKLFAQAAPDAIFMHCLPAHRGEEVTDEVADHERSVIFDQAENRLHAQKALLVEVLGGLEIPLANY